jgi:predicted phage terminase large subunit-like protein
VSLSGIEAICAAWYGEPPDDEEEGQAALTPEQEFEALEYELGARKLRKFIELFWPVIEPDVPFQSNWHIDAICDILEAVSRGELSRVILNVPPGCMKSILVSVMWPAWEWARKPGLRYLNASYSDHLTIRDNIRVRDIIKSAKYQQYYRLALKDDQNEKKRINTTDGGWRIATSVGGPGTGEHPDRFIIDDPHTAAQARSDAERQTAIDWVDRTASSRGVARDCRFVLVMQRLHEKDLTAHLKGKGGWTHIVFPMRFDPERATKWDRRSAPGELLWPKLFTEEKVKTLAIALGPYGAAGQLQQRPTPEGGGLFKRVWFRRVQKAPAKGRDVRGWDTAASEDGNDYTVGLKMRFIDGIFYVMHVSRGQWSPANVDTEMKVMTKADGRACSVREEREPGSAGLTVIAKRARDLAGYDYAGVAVNKDKVTRSLTYRAQCEAGNVVLVDDGTWNVEAYLAELENFPNGENDDQVDASSCAFNELTTGVRPVREIGVLVG